KNVPEEYKTLLPDLKKALKAQYAAKYNGEQISEALLEMQVRQVIKQSIPKSPAPDDYEYYTEDNIRSRIDKIEQETAKSNSKKPPIKEPEKESKQPQPKDGAQAQTGTVDHWQAIEEHARTTMKKLMGNEATYMDPQVQQIGSGMMSKGGPSRQ